MAIYRIYQDGQLFNRIVADESFVQKYYNKDGYSYEREPDPEPTVTEPEYTEIQVLAQQITDEELARIELGQTVTDLELMILGGDSNV